MNRGDPIWYRQTYSGGYGYQRDIPGTYLRATLRRFVIRLQLQDGGIRDVAVAPSNVRPRDLTTTTERGAR